MRSAGAGCGAGLRAGRFLPALRGLVFAKILKISKLRFVGDSGSSRSSKVIYKLPKKARQNFPTNSEGGWKIDFLAVETCKKWAFRLPTKFS